MSLDSLPSIDDSIRRSIKRTHALFSADEAFYQVDETDRSAKLRLAAKINAEYGNAKVLPAALLVQQKGAQGPQRPAQPAGGARRPAVASSTRMIEGAPGAPGAPSSTPAPSSNRSSTALTTTSSNGTFSATSLPVSHQTPTLLSQSLIRRREARAVKPDYHAPWKLMRVISGHLGWVRALAVEPGNTWFASGAGDRVVKIWDLASGELKLSLTGHISTVRGLAVSNRHPYLFSCGEDKMVKCWDLETNRVIRHYHGHLSGIYALSLHPTLDVLVTAGRDASARVWDMRTKAQVHVLSGHTGTIADVKCQESDPQVITGSMDTTIRLWDLAAGKTMTTLTHHHKSVRALAIHPTEYSFASGSAGGNNIKKWACPDGTFVHNFSGHDAIINTISVNHEGVFYSGADNGSITFWDYKTGLPFQTMNDLAQPGSLDAEAGVFCSTFDQTGSRLITGGADKTIKIWGQVA
ncbi:pre-mRNA-splicing factor PRP46, variant [Microbotryum lychnidis-dioicae p1A1 Lamole]|uniref:Pre-mRNA-splicing factor PRP46 n=1 Tax=Microbotryum lychnidis-dioicae (strain p1A1 Lamole / MvSl-1064) TaxID=683840 RepID=U5HCM9_USTV1|nr:pre-mRNA-splicing factor PRP46, variant [Microbotryum lychnidis-dioicae p1A1 Lamole]|eukprot:KDE04686.1 pre-mRNA-splicing factor PRP46, variant [Microbotryum lychnidis-dioicae p1A1 Lamole]